MDISKMNKLFIDSELKNSQRDILLSRIMNTNDDNDVSIYLRDQSIDNTAIYWKYCYNHWSWIFYHCYAY